METLTKQEQHQKLTDDFVKISKKLYRKTREQEPKMFAKKDVIVALRGILSFELHNEFMFG